MVASKNVLFPVWLVLIFLGWTLAISNQSFWLDEAHGAGWKAKQSTLAEWWRDDFAKAGSTDSQIPLYVFYIWVYAKVFGSSEWVLRAANLPWVFFGFWAWQKSFGTNYFLKRAVAVAAACSPFLWYYLNEARPYAMQVGSSFLIAGALQQFYRNPLDQKSRGWMVALCIGLIGLSGSNLLGQLWAGAAIASALFVFGWKQTKALVQRHWILCAATFIALAGLGIYYLWTLQSGSRATSVGATDAKNFVFIIYELLGFSGLGPGRLEIRGNGLTAFRPYVGWIAAYAIVLAPILFTGMTELWRSQPRKILGFTILFFGGVAVFLAGVGITSQFRLLGRHFTPALVLILFVLGAGISRMWSKNQLMKFCLIAFVTLSFVSCFALRFASRHAKDEYRGAAAIARAALKNKETVWWNADQRAAGYYGIQTRTNDLSANTAARFISNPHFEDLRQAVKPDVVICSRPDVYDEKGILFDYLQALNFHNTINLPAFAVWEKTSTDLKAFHPVELIGKTSIMDRGQQLTSSPLSKTSESLSLIGIHEHRNN